MLIKNVMSCRILFHFFRILFYLFIYFHVFLFFVFLFLFLYRILSIVFLSIGLKAHAFGFKIPAQLAPE